MKNNKKEKSNLAFTLIELLAVIIILGILMIIAVPAVTKFINGSKKSGYVSSAKSIVNGTIAMANSEIPEMKDKNTTYYIPASYIKTDNGKNSSYGEFKEAYVGVTYDDKAYHYYWISNDTTGQGIRMVTEIDSLKEEQIESNVTDEEIREIVETTGIEDRNKILILNLDGTWEEERTATHNINEDGEYEPVDTLLAIFVTGDEFNAKIKTLAGDTNPSYNTANTNIQYIKRSKVEPTDENKQAQNIVSSANSEVPIYAWFDNGTIYWWSEDIKPNLNSDASKMFTNFQGVKDIELKNIKTNLTTTFQSMFGNCSSLEVIDVSKFDTSNVTSMRLMFSMQSADESQLKEIKGLEKFDTRNVTNMSYMFSGLPKIKRLDLSYFNTSNVTSMQGMFQNMESLEQLDISNFDTSKVKSMVLMFKGASKLKKLDLSHFNTTNVIDMQSMFYSMKSLEQLDISNFDTSKVTSMASMFRNTAKLKELGISHFNTSNVTSMGYMFQNMESLDELNISNFNTSKVTDMQHMFGCAGASKACELKEIQGLENFDTSNVTTMRCMFVNQRGLRTLDLSNFNTANVNDMAGMFGATNLITIYASPLFDVSGVTASMSMFSKTVDNMWTSSSSYVLTGGAGTTYSSSHTNKEYARIDDPANGKPGYFTLKTS